MPKTTDQHFLLFGAEVSRWQDRLSLGDWDIQVRHKSIGTSLAQTSTNSSGGVATIALNTTWKDLDPISDERIKRVALHEVIHVLLADLYYIAECRYVTDTELEAAEHKIVRRLEKAIGG